MNANEIRAMDLDAPLSDQTLFLREIAAQLAELNANLMGLTTSGYLDVSVRQQ